MQSTQYTEDQMKLALAATLAVSETVRELGEVNEGVLYSVLMGKMDLASFERLLGVLVNAGVVERKPMGVIKWVGPNRDAASEMKASSITCPTWKGDGKSVL